MTVDEKTKELVKRLREYCSIDKGADPIMLKVLSVVRSDLSDAADTLEALAGEVERLKVQVGAVLDEHRRITFHWNEALKENAKLRAALEAKP